MATSTTGTPGQTVSAIDAEVNAVLRRSNPKVSGAVIREDESSVVLRCGDGIVEVPIKHVADRTKNGDHVELTLTPDANILVSTVVSMKSGFIGDNVFGALMPHVVACNCNCNCNCSGSAGASSVELAAELRRSFTGGAVRTGVP